MNRIWYDRRTKKYGASVKVQDGTEDLGVFDAEGDAQVGWVDAVWRYNHTKPSELGCKVPRTENVETPNPLAGYTYEQLMEEAQRRQASKVQ